MIGLSRLLGAPLTDGDALRYGRPLLNRKPVVVWNCTRTCNLHCVHCYADSESRQYDGELTTEEAKMMILDLAQYGVPALLFSGGEPLIRPDILELASFARGVGIRVTLSTNGTLITPFKAAALKSIGFAYVGISLDGLGDVNDRFRGRAGAFGAAVEGIRNCLKIKQKVGLRMTLTRHNAGDLENILNFVEAENILRVCFYHFVGSGRGRSMASAGLTLEETRHAMDTIIEHTQRWIREGRSIEVLTVDQHVDGIYLYLKLLQTDPARARAVLDLLESNGGGRGSSGVGIADIDFLGNVHPDQFWMDVTLGNVKERPFSEIWSDPADPLLASLRDRLPRLTGRCAACVFQKACGGSLRVRAVRAGKDAWASDPACYLTDNEIIGPPARRGAGTAV